MILTIVSIILVISVLVFVHEGGHFLAARHVGVRVQQFSIGFPPKMVGKKIGDTEFILSWIPLGGYVKLEGQNIDDEDERDPGNYASKSILQRLYILLAGPFMNLALAFLFMPLVFMLGVESPAYRHSEPVVAATEQNSAARASGFLPGDRIVAIGSQPVISWNEVSSALADQAVSSDVLPIAVEREGKRQTLQVESNLFLADAGFGWQPLIPPIVGTVISGTPSEMAGLQFGDRILTINGTSVSEWSQIPAVIQKGNGGEMTFEVERGSGRMLLKMTPEYIESAGMYRIGISPSRTERHGPVEAFALGSERLWSITSTTFAFLGKIITGKGTMDAVGGPVKIGLVIGEAARMGVSNLIFLMAVISLQLGVFNLLPIPALDGGHIFLLGLEKLKGSPLSAKLRERAQMVGFSLLILLILFVTYNDILRIIS